MSDLVTWEQECFFCKGTGRLDDPRRTASGALLSEIVTEKTFGPGVLAPDGRYFCPMCTGTGKLRGKDSLFVVITDIFERLTAIEATLAEREGDHR